MLALGTLGLAAVGTVFAAIGVPTFEVVLEG